MAGRIVDASLVPAPKQDNTEAAKAAIKAGRSAAEMRPDQPHEAARKGKNARPTPKLAGKVRYRRDGTPLPMIATPVSGCKSHIGIDRRFGFIRKSAAKAASVACGRAAPAPREPGEHPFRGLGGQRLSLAERRASAGRADVDEPQPPPQAGGPADAP